VTEVDREHASDEPAATTDRATTTDSAARIRRTLEGVLGVPATEGNRVQVLRNGDQIFPAMLEAIDQAEHTIDFLTFIYWQGEVGTHLAEMLSKRARAGEDVVKSGPGRTEPGRRRDGREIETCQTTRSSRE
jgi:phosphatidylserine/phosphatidylglycerophosphate/cardiolipin synthase-like enzyme